MDRNKPVSDGEIYSLASFGGDRAARDAFIAEMRDRLGLTNLSGQQAAETKPKPKPGEPGFQWPPCPDCGSLSLRCGCD